MNNARKEFRDRLVAMEQITPSLEERYQKEITKLKEQKTTNNDGLAVKVKRQQGLLDSLQDEKSNLSFDLDQKTREAARLKAEIDELKKETTMVEISQSEKM